MLTVVKLGLHLANIQPNSSIVNVMLLCDYAKVNNVLDTLWPSCDITFAMQNQLAGNPLTVVQSSV